MIPFTNGTLEGSSLWEVRIQEEEPANALDHDPRIFSLGDIRNSWAMVTEKTAKSSGAQTPWPLESDKTRFYYLDRTPHASVLDRHKGPSAQLGHLLSAWLLVLDAREDIIGHRLGPIVATGALRNGSLMTVNQVEHKARLFQSYAEKTSSEASHVPIMLIPQECREAVEGLLPFQFFEDANSLLVDEPTAIGVYQHQLPALFDALDLLAIRGKRRCWPWLLVILLLLLAIAGGAMAFHGRETNPLVPADTNERDRFIEGAEEPRFVEPANTSRL